MAGIVRTRRLVMLFGALSPVILIIGYARRAATPSTRSEVQTHFDHTILAYRQVDGRPYILIEVGGKVRLDTMRRDVLPMEWPPLPTWHWTGNWTTMATSDAPASGALSEPGFPADGLVFGQVNSTEIETIQLVADGEILSTESVSAPGFIIDSGEEKTPEIARFLDSEGEVVFEIGLKS